MIALVMFLLERLAHYEFGSTTSENWLDQYNHELRIDARVINTIAFLNVVKQLAYEYRIIDSRGCGWISTPFMLARLVLEAIRVDDDGTRIHA